MARLESNSRPLGLQSDALPTAQAGPVPKDRFFCSHQTAIIDSFSCLSFHCTQNYVLLNKQTFWPVTFGSLRDEYDVSSDIISLGRPGVRNFPDWPVRPEFFLLAWNLLKIVNFPYSKAYFAYFMLCCASKIEKFGCQITVLSQPRKIFLGQWSPCFTGESSFTSGCFASTRQLCGNSCCVCKN